MILLSIICVIATVLTAICIIYTLITINSDDGDSIVIPVLGFIFGLIILILAICESSSPRAIDVYRGKTTLEIVSKDGVPIDSVVVFKDK